MSIDSPNFHAVPPEGPKGEPKFQKSQASGNTDSADSFNFYQRQARAEEDVEEDHERRDMDEVEAEEAVSLKLSTKASDALRKKKERQ